MAALANGSMPRQPFTVRQICPVYLVRFALSSRYLPWPLGVCFVSSMFVCKNICHFNSCASWCSPESCQLRSPLIIFSANGCFMMIRDWKRNHRNHAVDDYCDVSRHGWQGGASVPVSFVSFLCLPVSSTFPILVHTARLQFRPKQSTAPPQPYPEPLITPPPSPRELGHNNVRSCMMMI